MNDANLPSRTPRAFVLPYSTMLAEKVEKAQVAASSERCKICQVDSDDRGRGLAVGIDKCASFHSGKFIKCPALVRRALKKTPNANLF